MRTDINIFLGDKGYIDALDRPESNTTMLVENFSDVNWEGHSQFPAILMEKLDGVSALAVNISGECRIFSSTGIRLSNVSHIESVLGEVELLRNQVMTFELVNDDFTTGQMSSICDSSNSIVLGISESAKWLSGCAIGAFDIVELWEFVIGTSHTPFEKRLLELVLIQRESGVFFIPAYTDCESIDDMGVMFDVLVETGSEGVVLCQKDSPWIAGYRNLFKTKLVKREGV